MIMRKTALLYLLFTMAAGAARAQTWAEWFQQEATQKKYLIQQVAALQVFIGQVQEGYALVTEGLRTIGTFTKGELDGHQGYIHSLKKINGPVGGHAKVAAIAAIARKIARDCPPAFRRLQGSHAYSPEELNYIQRVIDRLLAAGVHTLEALGTLLTEGQLDMKEGERLKRLDRLYQEMLDQYAFFQVFTGDAERLAAARMALQTEITGGRAWRGLTNNEP